MHKLWYVTVGAVGDSARTLCIIFIIYFISLFVMHDYNEHFAIRILCSI